MNIFIRNVYGDTAKVDFKLKVNQDYIILGPAMLSCSTCKKKLNLILILDGIVPSSTLS